MKLLCYLGTVLGLAAAQPEPLATPVAQLRLQNVPLTTALQTLGRSCGVNVTVTDEIDGIVSVNLQAGTLESALQALLAPGGYSFVNTPEGIQVSYRQTKLYAIDYPQLTRSGSGSASITLGGASQQTNPLPSPTNGQLGLVTDATQVSISQTNQNTFWNGLETELRAMLSEGDSLVLNPFGGIAQVTAPAVRQRVIRDYLAMVNRRITRQVEIEARIVEVVLHDEQKLGIDWEVASGGSLSWGANSRVQTDGVAGSVLAPATFTANLSQGRVAAIIQALQQQGDVRTVAQPRLRTLNNQTAFIKVGEDRPFFRLQQSTTFQQGGTTTPVNQTQESFSVSTITIGTILAVTPQVDARDIITLDVLPAITRLQSIATSPDGRQTAPVTEVKQASTIVRLRSGDTAVIGGLISEESGRTGRGVPGLGALPLIGRAFRSEAKLSHRSELVIFLTLKLLPDA